MIDTSKIIRAPINGSKYTETAPLWKEHYGIYLKIEGADLPDTYEVDFSNDEFNGSAVTMIGNADGVLIPHQFIDTGRDVFAFLYWVGEDYGKTVYKFKIPNKFRPDRTNEQPTPEEQSVIDQAIAALNDAVEQTAQDVIDADASEQMALGYAESAQESARQAQEYSTVAISNANSASQSASQASASATASANSASQSAQIKADVEGMVSDAQGYAQSASQSATASANSASQASASEQGCARAVLDAASAAAIARARAEEANGYAQTASSKAQDASTSAQTASTKASESAQSASQASGYATQAESAKTDAETAQGKAEDAQAAAESVAESIPSDYSQLSEDVSQLKEDFTDLKGGLSNSSTPIKFEAITGKYVKYIDGTLGTAESNGCTDYIDVSNYKQILFKQTASTASNPTSGTAFYDENKVYVSGIQAIKSMAEYGYYGELVLADIPNNAKYVRFTTWADTLTFGNFELYGVNEKYYESLSNNDLLNSFEKENNIVGLGGFYYQKWCNYGNSAARQVQILKYGNKFLLNGTTTADTRIKITNSLAVATTNGGVDGFANPLKFVIGHTYSATLRFIGTYPGAEGNVTLSAYKPSTHSSAGSLYWNKNGCVRKFTATQTDYNICIYINNGVTVTNLECIVEITDETGDYRNIAETYRIYDNLEYGTVQSGAIIGKKIYAYESNNSGSIVVIDTLTGESTSTSLSMGHGNDMTVYNGKLYVTSMEETGRIFIVDPDTLDIESYVDFTINGEPAVSFGIAYDKVNNQFVLEVEDDFVFADTSLVYKSSVARDYLSGSTRQGFECDGYYLYCPEYNKNNIVVYDYAGRFVKEISIPNSHEPEGLFNDWTGGWWLFTNIPSREWYVDAINFRNKLSFSMMCAVARVI